MKHQDYWQKRFEQLENAQNAKAIDHYYYLQEQYAKAIKNIEKDIARWYARYASENGISLTEAKRLLNGRDLAEFRMDVKEYIQKGQSLDPKWAKQLEGASSKFHVSRLEALKIQLQQYAEGLAVDELSSIDKLARDVYTDGYYKTVFEIQKGIGIGHDFMRLDKNKIDKVLSKPWAADGKNFSDRIWQNKTQLVSELENRLTQSIIRGQSPQKVIDEIAKRFQVNQSKAGRLVMTETAFFASAAQNDAFNELDVEQYEIVATLDSRTSETCRHMDGKVLSMKDFKAGVTAPPFHVYCRSTTCPYFEDDFTLDEQRAARSEDGKYYTVPSNMKYEEWENVFVKGGSKKGVTPISQASNIDNLEELKIVKQNLLDKHKGIINSIQKKEFDGILSNHNKEDLEFYNAYSKYVKSNNYKYKGRAHYSPKSHTVNMDINKNIWEQHAAYNYTGAWQTKFHEEFHQIDHLLRNTDMAKAANGSGVLYKLTNTNTIHGQKLITAIEKDILNFINKAIDSENAKGYNIKKLNSINRISNDGSRAFFTKLKADYQTKKQKAQIAMFTDMMGLATNNRLSPHNNGFWGHNASYNKQRSKDGATSETWATFGSYYFYFDAETKKILMDIMPNTLKEYEILFKKVVEYVKNNSLEYR